MSKCIIYASKDIDRYGWICMKNGNISFTHTLSKAYQFEEGSGTLSAVLIFLDEGHYDYRAFYKVTER